MGRISEELLHTLRRMETSLADVVDSAVKQAVPTKPYNAVSETESEVILTTPVGDCAINKQDGLISLPKKLSLIGIFAYRRKRQGDDFWEDIHSEVTRQLEQEFRVPDFDNFFYSSNDQTAEEIDFSNRYLALYRNIPKLVARQLYKEMGGGLTRAICSDMWDYFRPHLNLDAIRVACILYRNPSWADYNSTCRYIGSLLEVEKQAKNLLPLTNTLYLRGFLTKKHDTPAILGTIHRFLRENGVTEQGWRYLVARSFAFVRVFSDLIPGPPNGKSLRAFPDTVNIVAAHAHNATWTVTHWLIYFIVHRQPPCKKTRDAFLRALSAQSQEVKRRRNITQKQLLVQAQDVCDFAGSLNRRRHADALDKNQLKAAGKWSWWVKKSEEWHQLVAEQQSAQYQGQAQSSWPCKIETPVEIDNYVATPLLTGADLIAEGRAMRHCVASYIPWCEEGTSLIFSVVKRSDEAPQKVATIELALDGESCKVRQVRGPRNAQVPEQLIVVAETLRKQYLAI